MPDLLISSFQTTALVSFAKNLGISPKTILDEAINDWLTIVGPARLEEISQQEKSNVLEFYAGKAG